MAQDRRARRAARRAQARAAMAAAPPAAAPALLGDGQRWVVTVLLFSGLGLAAVAAFMPPSGAAYWVAVIAAPVAAVVLDRVIGGALGRALGRLLMGGEAPARAARPVAPAALPAPQRDALQAALLPALLAELAGAADRMLPPARAAARALVEAGATAPDGDPRRTLARDLPRLAAALVAGETSEAEALARRLAQPAVAP